VYQIVLYRKLLLRYMDQFAGSSMAKEWRHVLCHELRY